VHEAVVVEGRSQGTLKRPITGFELDEDSHWVAELACGHRQHTRHDPPFTLRPWVLSAEGRLSRIGSRLDCIGCDRCELPAGYEPYRRTDTFTETSTPEALRKAHSTKRGVWAFIHVSSGRLEYSVEPPIGTREVLTPASRGVILPEVPHHVMPLGAVEFFVEFWRRAKR
jgi:tellurite methyltransferase